MSAFAQEAEEEESPFSATFAVTTDYVFRGVSQTDNEPAFQAGASYSAPFGLYAGVWASNVDFGAGGPDVELECPGLEPDVDQLDAALVEQTGHPRHEAEPLGRSGELAGTPIEVPVPRKVISTRVSIACRGGVFHNADAPPAQCSRF